MSHKPRGYADEQVPINEEWEARESAFDEDGNLKESPQGPMVMRSFDAYMAPVTDDGGTHYRVKGRKEQERLMQATDSVDSRDVPRSMMNENVRKARGYEN